MRKPLTVALLLVIPLVSLGFAGASQAQLVLYDDFNKGPINPAKWSGGEGSSGPLAPNDETARKIAGKQLEIDLATWGRTDSNIGSTGAGSNLSVTNPGPVTTIQADVTVKSATVVGCAANTTRTAARASIAGGFFNDGTSPGPGDRTGDIFVGIQSVRNTITGDRIHAFVDRCTNANCTTFVTPFFVVFTASWVQGVANTLSVQWDKPNKQFIFTVNPGGSQEQHIFTYAFSDTNGPVVDFKNVQVDNSAASCLGPAPRASAAMKALFDNVMLNP